MLCGDSTSEADMQRLCAGSSMDLAMTSPPYNVGIDYVTYKDIAARDEYLGFIQKVATRLFACLAAGRFVAWNIGVSPKTYPHRQTVILEEAGFVFYRQIVWEKAGIPYPIFPSTMRTKRARHYKPNYKHELLIVAEKEGDISGTQACTLCEGTGEIVALELPLAQIHAEIKLMTKGDEPELGGQIHPVKAYQNDVWHISQSMATVDLKTVGVKSSGLRKGGKLTHTQKEHPAAYPVELPRAVMRFLSAAGEAVIDPFCGSGSTLIATEQLGRRCYGMEIDARYCDVIVTRWETLTGKKAERIKA